MATKLRDLIVKEVSLVDRPANPGARVVLSKREVRKDLYDVGRFAEILSSIGYLMQSSEYEAEYEGDNSQVPAALRTWLRTGASIFQSMASEEVNELLAIIAAKRDASVAKREGFMASPLKFFKSFLGARDALSESLKSIVDDAGAKDKPSLIDETLKQFSDHVEGEIEKTLSTGEVVNSSEGDEMSAALKKALGLADTATEADLLAAIAKKDADTEALKAAADLAKKSAPDAEAITKALADVEDLKKRNAVLENERELAKHAERAVEIGLTKAQGELLMKAHKGDGEALKSIENAIKGLNEQIATGKVFAEFGTSMGGSNDNAAVEVMVKAEELRKANPRLTIEKAKATVLEDPANRELFKRYAAENARPRAVA